MALIRRHVPSDWKLVWILHLRKGAIVLVAIAMLGGFAFLSSRRSVATHPSLGNRVASNSVEPGNGKDEQASRESIFGAEDQLEVTSRRVAGEYVKITSANLLETAGAIPSQVDAWPSRAFSPCVDEARRIAEVLLNTLALDQASDPELDSILSQGTPYHLRQELGARRRSSPNLFWESLNTSASKLAVRPLTTEVVNSIPGFTQRPFQIEGLDRDTPICLLLLSFEFEHYGRERGGTAPACNRAVFEFTHDPSSGTSTLIGIVQSNVLELAPAPTKAPTGKVGATGA